MIDVIADLVPLARVSVPKAGDVLADQLRHRIRAGELHEGQALPTERELAVQTGLSRMSVREALRILEVEGLIETRPGRYGGSRVRRPAGDALSRHLDLFIWGRNVGFEDLHDVREALEARAAERAAQRRTEADLADLVAKTEAVETAAHDIERYLKANLAWHMAVVRASHNELLIRIMNVLSDAIHRATTIKVFDAPELREATLRIHRAILAAIQAGDPAAAGRRMARHVSAARQVAVSWKQASQGGARAGARQQPSSARMLAARDRTAVITPRLAKGGDTARSGVTRRRTAANKSSATRKTGTAGTRRGAPRRAPARRRTR